MVLKPLLAPVRWGLQVWTLAGWGKPVLWSLCAAPALYLVWAVWADVLGANPAEALIRSLGEWALRFLCVALAVTPLRIGLGVAGLARWRRSLGLTAWVYAVLHLVAYSWLDMGFDGAEIWADILQRPFILVGTLTVLLLTALAVTSSHRAVRWLGGARWQSLHRLVYLAGILAIVHFSWMRTGKNHYGEVWLYGGVLMVLLGWRWWHRRQAPR